MKILNKCPVKVGDIVYWDAEPDDRQIVLSLGKCRGDNWDITVRQLRGRLTGKVHTWWVRYDSMCGIVIDREYRHEDIEQAAV